MDRRELLEQSLYDALQLPERAANHLESIGVFTLNDLLHCSSEQLLAIPNFGEKTLADIYFRLERIGFYRPGRVPEPPPPTFRRCDLPTIDPRFAD